MNQRVFGKTGREVSEIGLGTWQRCLFLVCALLLCLSGSVAEPNIRLQDESVRSGSWVDAYTGILTERSADIQAYQDYTAEIVSNFACHPVGLRDLTGDGIPELFFIELVDDTEYGIKVGRFRVYVTDGNGVHCALTMQPEIDDLLYSRYYLAEDGLLTVYLSDTDEVWLFQFRLDPGGHYTVDTTLIEQQDFSESIPDQYFLNGEKITAKKYNSLISQIRSAQGSLIGTLMVDDGGTGFEYTLQEALEALSSGKIQREAQAALQEMGSSGVQLSELSFSRGFFTAGQRLEVYSAPSAKSWRGAKGKAAVASGNEIYVAGVEDDWMLILYELDSGVTRAGYVDLRKVKGEYPSCGALSLDRVEMTLTKAAELTDDPIRQKSVAGKLKKGTKVTCLARYRGWIYAEAKVSGKTARGFLPPSSLGLAK